MKRQKEFIGKARTTLKEGFRAYLKSIWLFPSVAIIVFAILVATGINGSSVGALFDYLGSGSDQHDSNLLVGRPRGIRSDEWGVTSQMIVAQHQENYPSVNENIGDGQNMNLLLDVPVRDWSQIFRPQNHAFFVIGFDNAFAYHWWFGGFMLLIGVYFLALHFMPGKRLISSLIAVSTLFSGFIQWWYATSNTLCMAYGFIIVLLVAKLIESRSAKHRLLLSAALVYCLVAFALLLYPPSQIPIVIAVVFFSVGYLLYVKGRLPILKILRNLAPYIIGIILVTASTLGAFLYQNRDAVNSLLNTVYPGERVISSGGYSTYHLLSGSLALQQQRTSRADNYIVPDSGINNQSESSTFILISFALIPLLFMSSKDRRRKLMDPLTVCLLMCVGLFVSWLFVPNLDIVGHLTKLSMVPHNRLVIGLGFINILLLIVFVKNYTQLQQPIKKWYAAIYCLLLFIVTAFVHLKIQSALPSFISIGLALLLAAPLPIAVFLILRKFTSIGLAVLAVFSIAGSALVNPLYIGTKILIDNPLSQAIQKYPEDRNFWIAEDIVLENIATINGKRSLSGVYIYPQLHLWEPIDNGQSEDKYNRYAHTSFSIDRDRQTTIKTGFVDASPDQLVVRTEACSDFIKNSGVKYIVSSGVIDQADQQCVSNVDKVTMPNNKRIYFIYTLNF